MRYDTKTSIAIKQKILLINDFTLLLAEFANDNDDSGSGNSGGSGGWW